MQSPELNLIIFGSAWDLYQCSYYNLIKNPNVKYIPGLFPKNKIARFLYRLHFSHKLNKIINLPYKELWNKYYFKDITRNRTYIFLFFSDWIRMEPYLKNISYIREKYKGSKVVWFLQDLSNVSKDYFTQKVINLSEYKDKFDLIISFDKEEAEKYKIGYFHTVYSPIMIEGKDFPKTDVVFIGKDKGRLNLLVQIYDKLTNEGLICYFIMFGVDEDKRIFRKNIHYIDKMMPYKEALRFVKGTNCILELMQDNAIGYTFRTWESIAYNKKLLTNNSSLIDSNFYDTKYVSIFSSKDNIDENFLKSIKVSAFNENPFYDCIKPESLIHYIEQKLKIKIRL